MFFHKKGIPMQRRNAFTLVELLVVIAIISILAALLLPTLEQSMGTARKLECASRMKQIMTLSHAYSGDYRVVLPWNNFQESQFQYLWPGLLMEASLLDQNLAASFNDKSYCQSYCDNVIRPQSILTCPSGYTEWIGDFWGYGQNDSNNPEKLKLFDSVANISGRYHRPTWFPASNNGLISTNKDRTYWRTYDVSTDRDVCALRSYNIASSSTTFYKIGSQTYTRPRKTIDNASHQLYLIEGSRLMWGAEVIPQYMSSVETFRGRWQMWYYNWRSRHMGAANFSCYDGHVSSYSEEFYWTAYGKTDAQVQEMMDNYFIF